MITNYVIIYYIIYYIINYIIGLMTSDVLIVKQQSTCVGSNKKTQESCFQVNLSLKSFRVGDGNSGEGGCHFRNAGYIAIYYLVIMKFIIIISNLILIIIIVFVMIVIKIIIIKIRNIQANPITLHFQPIHLHQLIKSVIYYCFNINY